MLVCAFVGERSWERALIISEVEVHGETKIVKVFCIDWGTVGNRRIDQCRRLKEEWNLDHVQRQAYRGILHGIQPIDKTLTWDLKITLGFITKIFNEELQLEVVTHDREVNFCRIFI
jgi:hypothetical protein